MNKVFAIILGIISWMLVSCNSENESLTQVIEISSDISVLTPEGFVFEPIQGIDSYVGRIIDPSDSTFLIFMDIGELAGLYVDPEEPKPAILCRSENGIMAAQRPDRPSQ